MKIIIPSAKVVPEELQNLGKLPPIIYPVGKGIVFDYIIDQYKNIEPVYNIICFEEARKVEQRLEQYKDTNIRLITLEKLGDLGESILYGLEAEKKSNIIINFADTIVMDHVEESPNDCIYYSEDYISDVWTYFEIENGEIIEILDKKNCKTYKEKKKLFIGLFKRILTESINKQVSIDSFYYALVEYSKIYPMNIIETKNWYDIGHAQKYFRSNLEVKAREFNNIKIDRDRGILKKQSRNVEKFIGEILWYLKLPSDIEYLRPRIFSYSTRYDNPFVEMEYYSYHTLHELFINGDLSFNQWLNVFRRLKFIINDLSKYQVKDKAFNESLEEMYVKKTFERLKLMKKQSQFKLFFKNPITINGIKYKSLDEIWELIKKNIPKMLYDVDYFSIIHGDLCFTNILIDSNLSIIKLIDPRGEFGKFDIYGDQRYELAKLVHSIDGKYDYIIRDMFDIKLIKDSPIIEFHIKDNNREFSLYDCFSLVFKDEMEKDQKKIEFVESLLFLSMIPLHSENINHQFAMLATGLQILNRVINIRYYQMEEHL